jgi:multiple sugar transport system substrate-binding protein
MAPMVGAKWLKDDGTSAIGSDPKWQELLKWQKDLVDWYGYDKLEKFRASLGDEWSADNAFQKGQVAMAIDGEWRIAFVKDQAPTLDFGVAPLPVSDPSRAGAGYITGTIAGVTRTAKNPEAAWALIKFLTLETDSIVDLANGIKNVPTTTAALASPNLQIDPAFKTFLDIFANPNSDTTPPSAIGSGYQDIFSEFLQAWQSGSKKDLTAGLTDVDTQIDKQIKLAG